MLKLNTRTKSEKEVRNGYILATTGVFIFFPAVYFYIRDMVPGTGQGGS